MNQKAIIFIGICLLLVLPSGCKKHEETSRQLKRAEELMNIHADSAYILLQQVDTKLLFRKQEKARYALLLSQALDKNYIDISSDSIIRRAVAYYQSNGTPEDRAKCFYYRGVVYNNAQQLDTAIASYTRAIHYAEKSKSANILGLAHHALAHAMYKQKCYKDALQHFSKAHEFFKKKEDLQNTLYSAVSIAYSLQRLNRSDEAKTQYLRALNLANSQQDTLQIHSIGRALASLYLENGQSYAFSIF